MHRNRKLEPLQCDLLFRNLYIVLGFYTFSTRRMVSIHMSALYLSSLEHCFWVQCLSLFWVVFVGLDPADIFTPPESPLLQALKPG